MIEDVKVMGQTLYHKLYSQYHAYQFNRAKESGIEALAFSEYHLKRYHYHVAKFEALEKWYSFR